MNLAELQAVVDGFAPVIRDQIAQSVARMVADAVRAMPQPIPGADGKSVTVDDVLPALKDALQGEIAPLVDARVQERVERAVEAAVAPALEAVAAIPVPRDGADGKDGRDGVDGQAGADGLAGKDGAPGADGKDGAPGTDGADGRPGRDGDAGRDGADGRPGDAGRDGADGRPGRDGEDGRDAAQIEPIDGIDTAKSYPRGTWAVWRGGLVRSVRATEPLGEGDIATAGWHVVIEGVAGIEIEHDGERAFTVKTLTTGGRAVTKSVSLPVVLYREVWTEKGYEAGDSVTWAGSLWIAKRATADKPGDSDAWRLAVKRGQNGRDAK